MRLNLVAPTPPLGFGIICMVGASGNVAVRCKSRFLPTYVSSQDCPLKCETYLLFSSRSCLCKSWIITEVCDVSVGLSSYVGAGEGGRKLALGLADPLVTFLPVRS